MHDLSADRAIAGWRSVGADMLAGTQHAIARFPVAALVLLVMAVQANAAVGGWAWAERLFEANGLPLATSAMAALAIALTCESHDIAPALRHAASLLAAAAIYAIGHFDTAVHLYEWTFLAAIAGFVLVGPFIARGTSDGFWMFVVAVMFAGLLALFALLLIAGGLSAIVASFSYLFGIEVPESLYGHVWMTTGLLAAPLFGIGQLPRTFDQTITEAAPRHVEASLRTLGEFVAAPMILIYAALLHVYAAKIIVSGEWPEGQVGWLVLTFGFCLFAALMVLHPFLRASRPPMRTLIRIWRFILPVPVGLLFLAAYQRIAAYGITPERYLLVLFGLVTLIVVVLQLWSRFRGDIRPMAALPVLALLIASFGPFGAIQTSISSQSHRFERLLGNDGRVADSQQAEASSILRFLETHHGLDVVALDEADFSDADADGASPIEQVASAYGVDLQAGFRVDGPNFSRAMPESPAIDASGFDVVIPSLAIGTNASQPISMPGGAEISIELEGSAILVHRGETTVRFALSTDQRAVWADGGERGGERVDLSSGTKRLALVASHVHGRRDGPTVDSVVATVLLNQADWN